MTEISAPHVFTSRQLARRDGYVAAAVIAAIASLSIAWHSLPSNAEVIPVITGDAVRVAQFVCRKNSGIANIEPQQNQMVTFNCNDGAKFTDTVLNLK